MERIRKDFPFFRNHKDLIYVDNAATTHKPDNVLAAMHNFYTQEYSSVHRGIYGLAENATKRYEQARATVASFIGAQAHELVFTKGATESINLLANSLAHIFQPGDEILLSELEHHANIVPWQQLALAKKLKISYIPVLANGTLDISSLDTLVNERTKLISVTLQSNVTGAVTPLESIRAAAVKVGALLLVDAAQALPHRALDVKALGVDFLVGSGHKLMGPTGIGFLYADFSRHELLKPYQTGGGMVFSVDAYETSFRPYPALFEAGTPLIAQAIGLEAAINYLKNHIGFDRLQAHENLLTATLIDGLEKIPAITILGPVEELKSSGHLVSFTLENWHAHDVAAYLDSLKICVRAGNHCAQLAHKKLGIQSSVRISFYVYNNLQEINKIVKALERLSSSKL